MGSVFIAWALQAAGQVFEQQTGGDGLIVAEAESFGANTPQGGHTWDLVTAPAGFVGTGAMQANPNTGAGPNTGYAATAPRLDFRVLFRAAGTHYVWVRGFAPTMPSVGNNDSCHVGLDGAELASSDRMTGWNDANYTWRRTTMDNANATFDVAAPGVHVVNLWMREDGFIADKILITTNANYAGISNGGTQNGPPQSPQVAETPAGAAAAPVLTPGPFMIRVDWTAVTNADSYILERSANGGAFATVFSGPGLTYTDNNLTQTNVDYCYRVTGVNATFGPGPVSPAACARSQTPPPRTKDHDEGLFDGDCACGSSIPGVPAGGLAAGACAALLLLALRRR